MAGVTITIETALLDRLLARLNRWAQGRNMGSLFRSIGAEVESQTRRRIEDERRGPDGQAWAEWSESYAATRHGNHSLLQNEGDLVDSITAFADEQSAAVGSNLAYAATHQFGRDGIPARPFLGLSHDNEQDVLDVTEGWINQQLRTLQ